MSSLSLMTLTAQWVQNLRVDLTRYAIFALAIWFALWVVLAVPLAHRKVRSTSPPWRQLVTEFGVSLRTIAIFSTVGLFMFVMARKGIMTGPDLAASWGWVWGAISLVLMIVAHDAWFYWTHRAMHDPRIFRFFHRRHHRSFNPSPFSAYSFDVTEAFVQAIFVPIWLMIVPTSFAVVGFFMVHQIARNTLGHCGYEIFPARRDGRPLFGWMTSVTHHDLHHGEARWNYGLYFSWWDRWMGTEHPQYLARFATAARRPQLAATEEAA